MQRLYPAPVVELDPESIYDDLRERLPEPPAGRPYVLVNMVTSVDGKAAVGGAAAPLGSALDHRLMRALRAACDGVLIGAATLRAERVDPRVGAAWAARRAARGQPPEPLALILTRAGDLPLDRRYFAHPGVPRLVIAGAGMSKERRAALASRAELLLSPTPVPDLAWALGALRARHNVGHLLVEGGPTLVGELLAAGLVDELCWTLAPALVGGGEALTMVEGSALPAPQRLRLLSAYLHLDEFFLRYHVGAD